MAQRDAKRAKRFGNDRRTTRPVDEIGESPLRGLLPVPVEVSRLVAREVLDRPMTAQARERVQNEFTLQFYFGGQEVAYRETSDGLEVLAAGADEISSLLQHVPHSERRGIVIGHPEPW